MLSFSRLFGWFAFIFGLEFLTVGNVVAATIANTQDIRESVEHHSYHVPMLSKDLSTVMLEWEYPFDAELLHFSSFFGAVRGHLNSNIILILVWGAFRVRSERSSRKR